MERTASRPIELAFYGGTFTALPERLQMECLALAMQAKEKGIVCRVRCSTRPDALGCRHCAMRDWILLSWEYSHSIPKRCWTCNAATMAIGRGKAAV